MRVESERMEEREATAELIRQLVRDDALRGEFMILFDEADDENFVQIACDYDDVGGKSDGWFNDCPQYIGVYAGTEHAAEAIDFLNFFYNDETAAAILGTVRSVPPTVKAQEICEKEGTLNQLTKESVAVSMQYNGKSDGGPTTGSEVTAILTDAYENVSHGTMSPAEAAKETVELLTDYTDAHK